MFTTAVFTVGKIGKQPKGLLKDEWLKKKYIYIYIYNSGIYNEVLFSLKKKLILPYNNMNECTWRTLC